MIDPSLITSVDPPPGGEHLNIQISPCGTKIWVCIDGANVFRYRNLKGITIDDQRPNQGPDHGQPRNPPRFPHR